MYADDYQLYEINENVSTVNYNLNSNATKRQYGISLIYSRGTFPNTILC